MLELENVSYAYQRDQQTLRNVSLTIDDGEFLAIAGRNGSGKTTLTRLIMSLIKPDSGCVFLNKVDCRKYTPADMARSVGYVFQNPDRQIFHNNVAEEVAYGPRQLGFSEEQVTQAVNKAMNATGLSELAAAFPQSLSKGQKQRVAIASALAMQPKMLILDEPTSGQDAAESERLMQILCKLNNSGVTILLVTHDMELLSNYVKRVIVLAEGSKVFDGKVAELFSGAYDVAAWGLLPPLGAAVSLELADLGLKPAVTLTELCSNIAKLVQGERYV